MIAALRALTFAGLLLLGACAAGLQQNTPQQVWVGLEPKLPTAGLAAGGPRLLVLPFGTEAPFRSDRLASREGEGRWNFAYYHRWLASPGDLVAFHAREYLSRCGFFGAVLSGDEPAEPDLRLGGAVRTLYWDRKQGEAVLELEASLAGSDGRFLGFWVYRARSPVGGQGNDVTDFLSAASDALTQVLKGLAADVTAAAAPGAGGLTNR